MPDIRRYTKAQLVEAFDELLASRERLAETLGAQITKTREDGERRIQALIERQDQDRAADRQDFNRQRVAYIQQADELRARAERLTSDLMRARIQVEALTTALVVVAEQARDDDA